MSSTLLTPWEKGEKEKDSTKAKQILFMALLYRKTGPLSILKIVANWGIEQYLFSTMGRKSLSLREKAVRDLLRGVPVKRVAKTYKVSANTLYVWKHRHWAEQLATFRPFASARKFVRSLKLQNYKEWKEYARSTKRPRDIPITPHGVYAKYGWDGYNDWLGNDNTAFRNRTFRTFRQARAFVRKLKLKNQIEWREYCKSGKRPKNIPSSPRSKYKDHGWDGFGDWLGTGRIATFQMVYRPFRQARTWARDLGLKNRAQWKEFARSNKNPGDIPINPNIAYKDKGWKGMGDWLGTGNIASSKRVFRPFRNARAFVRKLKLKNYYEWRDFAHYGKRPMDIPTIPNRTYKNKGWKGYGDWLGTGTPSPFGRVFRTFKQARAFARKLKLKNVDEWYSFTKSKKRPLDIPANPYEAYRGKGWKGMGDFLGTGTISPSNKVFRSFTKAKAFARSLKLKNQQEWQLYSNSGKRPQDIPSSPPCSIHGQGVEGIRRLARHRE